MPGAALGVCYAASRQNSGGSHHTQVMPPLVCDICCVSFVKAVISMFWLSEC